MKRVLIKSIGTANPGVSGILAEAFGINQEAIARLLYNAPTVFLDQTDEETAQKALQVLSNLGLEVVLMDSFEELPKKSDPLDVAVYVQDPRKLMLVSKQLAEFLGVSETDALGLLMNEPSVVLGGVSLATAESLQKRLEAEVMASNPKLDLFTVEILSEKPEMVALIQSFLKKSTSNPQKGSKFYRDLSYSEVQALWQRFPNSSDFGVYNQSYQRHQILLEGFDLNNQATRDYLVESIGMPISILEEIHQNLPILLEESVNAVEKEQILKVHREAGLEVESLAIPFGKYKIRINNVRDKDKVQALLGQFFENIHIGSSKEPWTAPTPLSAVLNRYLDMQLSFLGCEVEHHFG